MIIVNRETLIKKIVRSIEIVKILVKFNIIIFFKLRNYIKLSTNRDFMFILQRIDRLKFNNNVFLNIINVNINIVIMQNINNKTIFLFKSCCIDII